MVGQTASTDSQYRQPVEAIGSGFSDKLSLKNKTETD